MAQQRDRWAERTPQEVKPHKQLVSARQAVEKFCELERRAAAAILNHAVDSEVDSVLAIASESNGLLSILHEEAEAADSPPDKKQIRSIMENAKKGIESALARATLESQKPKPGNTE